MRIPVRRSPHQTYLMFSIEPFSHCAYLTPWEETVLADFFNATISFRRDSDIPVPYGWVEPRRGAAGPDSEAVLQAAWPRTPEQAELTARLHQKTGHSVWLASHCWTDSGREEYVKELSRWHNVTVAGKCASLLNQQPASNVNLSHFYFYLAFEVFDESGVTLVNTDTEALSEMFVLDG